VQVALVELVADGNITSFATGSSRYISVHPSRHHTSNRDRVRGAPEANGFIVLEEEEVKRLFLISTCVELFFLLYEDKSIQ
jgi:hypothetical protein